MKFEAAYNKLYVARISSALSCYGKSFLNSNKRGKIKVQATAVARKKNGSRQKQDYGHRKNLELPKRRIKRQHNISKIIDSNEPAEKKSGLTMVSVTTYSKKKKPL